MLRFLTAGESHGKGLVGLIEGLPHGLAVDIDFINLQLRRRQLGYGRGNRMKIESDRIEIMSGVRHGVTLGSPISFIVHNKDWSQWEIAMSAERVPADSNIHSVFCPRPGHADLAGALKYQIQDVRDVFERASARETAARVAAGAFSLLLLKHFGIQIGSHVVAVGRERIAEEYDHLACEEIFKLDPNSAMRCADPDAERRMMEYINEAQRAGNTLGGIVEVVAASVPPGLGSHIQWDRRLDALIAQAMMSIPAAKAVEIGSGISSAESPGAIVHDEIFYDSKKRRFYRKTNRAGGVEGGISNGSDIRARIHMKPIPTLPQPLRSVDLRSKQVFEAAVERSDTCVVPAAGVIAEAMLGLVIACAFLDKFGGDSIKEMESNYANFMRFLDEY